MAVITITITESPIQVVSGIPQSIVLSTNIPATIFYTLDGTDPTLSSDIAIGAITLPTDKNTVKLKVFATDGADTCPIVTYGFGPNWVPELRRPRDTVEGLCSTRLDNQAFSTSSPNPNVKYGNTGGITVDDPNVAGVPDGFDGTATGTVVVSPDKEYNRTNYDIVYSQRNSKGEFGRGIGNLPADVTIDRRAEPTTISDANSRFFDPRALVIIQDGREDPDIRNPLINRQFFSLGDKERIRNGMKYHTTAFDGNVPTGSLIKPQYNPKDNTWIFYSRDSETNRWIISIEPNRVSKSVKAIHQVKFPKRSFGEKKVFRWFPFKRSHLI